MLKNGHWRKGLVFIFIILIFGVSITSAVPLQEKGNEKIEKTNIRPNFNSQVFDVYQNCSILTRNDYIGGQALLFPGYLRWNRDIFVKYSLGFIINRGPLEWVKGNLEINGNNINQKFIIVIGFSGYIKNTYHGKDGYIFKIYGNASLVYVL